MDWEQVAQQAVAENRLGDAIQAYGQYLSQNPNSAEANLKVALFLEERAGDVTNAVDFYLRAAQLSGHNPAALVRAGRLLTAADRSQEAINVLNQVPSGDRETDLVAFGNLVTAYDRLGQLDQAVAAALSLLEKWPDAPFSSYLVAWAYTNLGQYPLALRHIADTIMLAPADPFPVAFRTMLLGKVGRIQEMQRSLQEMTLVHTNMVRAQAKPESLEILMQFWRQYRHNAKQQLGVSPETPVNFVVMYGGLGDQYHCVALLAAYRQRHPGIPLVAIISPKAKWAELFPDAVDLYVTMPDDYMLALSWINRVSPDFPYIPNLFWYIGHMGNQWAIPQLVDAMLGLPLDTQLQPVPVTPDQKQQALDLFAEYGGKTGRSVLISNVSNTQNLVGDEWWVALVDTLTQAGFVVFQNVTNTFGNKQGNGVSTAIPINIPMHILTPFVEECGHFVGIRSGLTDFLNCAKAKLISVQAKKYLVAMPQFPVGQWMDIQGGLAMARCSATGHWRDVEVHADLVFDPAVVAEWL